MIRHRFRYERPDTLAAAATILAVAGNQARVLGGGSVLIPALFAGEDEAGLVLDPARLGLDRIVDRGDTVAIGARATYAALTASDVIARRLPLLAAMVREITGGPGLWNLATLGGAVCYANPASDGPGCLTTLQARVRLVSSRGERIVPIAAFLRDAFRTDRKADELVCEFLVPAARRVGASAYLKLKHGTSSWPIVTASSLIADTEDGPRLRLCIAGAAPTPILAESDEGVSLSPDQIAAFARATTAQIRTEWADELAGPGYRRAVAARMAARAVEMVVGASR